MGLTRTSLISVIIFLLLFSAIASPLFAYGENPSGKTLEIASLYPAYSAAGGKSGTAFFAPSDEAVKLSATGQPLTGEEIIYYSLVFSGVEKEGTDKYLEKYRNLVSGFKSSYTPETAAEKNGYHPDYLTGGALLEYLHGSYLKKYSENVTALDILFDSGTYNCVSSAILYFAAAADSGLFPGAVRTFDHAFCVIQAGGETIDVETTTRYGFDPGEKKEFSDSFGKTGFVYTPPGNYRDRNEISDKELVSLVLQNRISVMQGRGNYTGTVPLAVDRAAVLGTPEAFNEMANEFKNHAVQLAGNRKNEEAVAFLAGAASVYGYHPVITDTAGKLFYNTVVYYLEKNRTDEAEIFYDTFADEELMGAGMVREALSILAGKKLYLFVAESSFDDSRAEIGKYSDAGLIKEGEKKEYLVFLYSREIQKLAEAAAWREALETVSAASEDAGPDKRLEKLQEAIEHNAAVTYHNKFASHFNRGEKELALKALEEGLEIVPESRTLLSDLEFYRKNSGTEKKR